MSAYDTIERADSWWVRVYCEVPMDPSSAVMLEVGDRDEAGRGCGVVCIDPDEAVRIATALLVAAQRARQAATVDRVVATGAAHEASAR